MGSTVCIIDDDDDMRNVLSHVARSAGLPAALYDSVETFLRRADNAAIGCIVVDVQLRGLKGVALLTQLAEGDCYYPVFLISGVVDPIVAAAAKRLGAVIIDKPFDARRLADRLRTAVTATGP